jgi:hypothetical protein
MGPVADEAMTARRRSAGANGRSLACPPPSFIIFLLVALGSAIPALAAESGSRFGSQALFIAELALLLLVGRLMRRNELAVLKEVAALAERYDVQLRSTTRRHGAR